jgi:hypothetical protein
MAVEIPMIGTSATSGDDAAFMKDIIVNIATMLAR